MGKDIYRVFSKALTKLPKIFMYLSRGKNVYTTYYYS